jgi:hypothetical protein
MDDVIQGTPVKDTEPDAPGAEVIEPIVAAAPAPGEPAELAAPSSSASPTPDEPSTPSPDEVRQAFQGRIASGANWLYWIAGLSLVNAIIFIAGGSWSFLIGLALIPLMTPFADEAAGPMIRFTAMGICLTVVVFWGLLGYLATRRKQWAFVTAIVLYLIDTLLYFAMKDWVDGGFHLYVLYCLWSGARTNHQLGKLEKALQSP